MKHEKLWSPLIIENVSMADTLLTSHARPPFVRWCSFFCRRFLSFSGKGGTLAPVSAGVPPTHAFPSSLSGSAACVSSAVCSASTANRRRSTSTFTTSCECSACVRFLFLAYAFLFFTSWSTWFLRISVFLFPFFFFFLLNLFVLSWSKATHCFLSSFFHEIPVVACVATANDWRKRLF